MTSLTEFLGLASKLLPEFDGAACNLQRFLDALSIIDSIKGTHENTAVELIKTKLKGTVRNFITTENTIEAMKIKLKNSVKGDSVDVLTAKLLNTKQNNKTANAFSKEIEDLTKELENAYITDGLTADLATKYATSAAVKSITKNTNNEKVKIIMESGNFKDMNEVVSKFVSACNGSTFSNHASVLYMNRNRNFQNDNRGRGRSFNNFNQRRPNNYNNYNNYNNSSTNYRNNNNPNRNNFNRNRGTHRPNNNSRNNVRYINQPEQGNDMSTQEVHLGQL